MNYINIFFLYSFLGHFIETFFYPNGESGILTGWWTPVYGIGTVIILLLYKFIKKYNFNKIVEIILVFLNGAVFLSIIEYIGGILIEKIFNQVFWDYSGFMFNFGKYAALEMAVVWGISSLIVVYVLRKITFKIAEKIPKLLTLILIILFGFDLYYSILLK